MNVHHHGEPSFERVILDAQAQEIEALDQLRAAIIAGHPKAR